MKKLLIITAIVLLLATSLIVLITIIGESKLSDETLEEVRKLSYKHYGWYKGDLVSFTGCMSVAGDGIEWTQDFLSIWVKDGKLFVETQDGKWFIEMEKVTIQE